MKTMFSIADSGWRGCLAGGLVASLACVSVGVTDAGAAASGACTPKENPTPYNVVLFLLDDTSSAEIPFLGVPVDWNNGSLAKSTATTVGNTTVPAVGTETLREARTRRPDLNRLAARMYAKPGSPSCGNNEKFCDLDKNFLHPNAAAKEKKVIPLGFGDVGTDTTDTDFYKERLGSGCQAGGANCDPRRDVLTTHGGLRQLALEGVAYPRFYATSGRCTPTRASILTGRHPREVGVTDNGNDPKKKATMIGDYLKAMCPGEGTCYDTGFVGKWHVGGSEAFQQTPWQRGFDEAIYFSAGSRKPWSMGEFRCNSPKTAAQMDLLEPGTGYFCDYSDISSPVVLDVENVGCQNNTDCSNRCTAMTGESGGSAVCICGADEKCRILNPKRCDSNDDCSFVRDSVTISGVCKQWGQYVGPQQAASGVQRRACSPTRATWDPDCCAAATVKDYTADGPFDEIYDPADKNKAKLTQNETPSFWKTEETDNSVCRDDRHYRKATAAETAASACMYDTRFYRDMAVNFISRHRYTPNDSRRFFLEVSLHAMHGVQAAPASTLAHYDPIGGKSTLDLERTQRPHASTKYWGMMEEVDAAVGAVLRELAGEDQGGGGGTSILDNTVVLLTSDQGRPSAGFGAPAFRDGKGSTHEGGLRVGLLARVPGGANLPGRGKMLDGGHVGSQTDLFATIADAAGCQGGDKGEYQLGSCKSLAGKVCSLNADCAADATSCGSNGKCMNNPAVSCTTATAAVCLEGECEIVTMGKSLLAELSDATTPARNASYGRYIGAPKAVITRKGYIQDGMLTDITTSTDKIGVCGVKVELAGKGDAGADHTADVIRRAGSCRTCKVGDATACGNKACIANGNYCVPASSGNDLTDECKVNGQADSANCPKDKLATFRRCSAAEPCTGGYKCMNIEVPCDECFEAEWKFLGGAGDGNGEDAKIRPQALYDLATNPEELDIPDRKSPEYTLNCLHPPTDDATNVSRLQAIGKHLCRRLDLWTDCVNAQDGAKCDFRMPSEGVASGFLGPDLELAAGGRCQPPLSTP